MPRLRDLAIVRQPADATPGTVQIVFPQWMDDSLCAQVDSELFFPGKGGATGPAKSVCRRCPVREECLAYAIANEERYGVWGGVSERDRRKLAKGGTLRPPPTCVECGQVMLGAGPNRMYCSHRCRVAHKAREAA